MDEKWPSPCENTPDLLLRSVYLESNKCYPPTPTHPKKLGIFSVSGQMEVSLSVFSAKITAVKKIYFVYVNLTFQ